jgi:hypothetical protein
MKKKIYNRVVRLDKIDEHKIYHLKQYEYNILLHKQNPALTICLERIKNLYALTDETKNIIYNMSPEEKMIIISEYDNNLQSILKNILI